MEYNNFWTREKHIEYRKLKRSGYDVEKLKEHFGEDLYHSGMYNKKSTYISHILKYSNFITKIKINPEKVQYNYIPQVSYIHKNKTDYLLTFNSGGVAYVICLFYFIINNIETYNVVFTTQKQWLEYTDVLFKFSKKKYITDDEFILLDRIIGKETNYNNIYNVFKKISFIILDFHIKFLKNMPLSIGITDDDKKIKLYRNIIKNSFPDFTENETIFNDVIYYIFNKKL